MHDHLQEGDSGNSNVFEVVGINLPRFGIADSLLLIFVIGVESIAMMIDKLDMIVEL